MPPRLLTTSKVVRIAVALLVVRLVFVWAAPTGKGPVFEVASAQRSVTPQQNLLKADPVLEAIKLGNSGKAGDSEAALKTILKDGDNAAAHNALGVLYARQKKSAEALAEFDAAIKADPKLPDAWFNRASLRLSQGDKDGARDDYRKTVELKPGSPEMLKLAERELAALEGKP